MLSMAEPEDFPSVTQCSWWLVHFGRFFKVSTNFINLLATWKGSASFMLTINLKRSPMLQQQHHRGSMTPVPYSAASCWIFGICACGPHLPVPSHCGCAWPRLVRFTRFVGTKLINSCAFHSVLLSCITWILLPELFIGRIDVTNEQHTASIEKEPAKFQKVLWILRQFMRVNTRSTIDTFTVWLTDQHKTETFLFLSKQTVDNFILLKLAKVSSLIRDAVCNSCTESIQVVHVAPRTDVGHPKPSQNLGLNQAEL